MPQVVWSDLLHLGFCDRGLSKNAAGSSQLHVSRDRNHIEAAGEITADCGDHFLDDLDNGATATTEAETPESLPSGSALLVVKRGPNAGSRFWLDQPVTLAGRHPDSDILLDDITVSRRHAEFRLDKHGSWTVADVGSLNGTYVNRQPVDSAVLANNDQVQIGKFRWYFSARRLGSHQDERIRFALRDRWGKRPVAV